jgi:hypothetical protein
MFFQFYNAFFQQRTKLDSNVSRNFQEMIFKIDEHRGKLKRKIDLIASNMIDETRNFEKIYLNNLKEKFSSFDDSKSLVIDLNQLEEIFREPNLLIETIKEMQQKQDESLNDIQSKLNEIHVKELLEDTNDFQPNLSFFNQKDTSLFGSIKLDGYWLNTNSFKSEVLKGERQCLELLKLCEFSPNDKWSLLYRGTRDGFGSDDFHSKCDGHANTLTIFKAKQSSYIFGGYTSVSWESSANGKWKSDPNAFMFSLKNKENRPLKMKVDQNFHHYAVYCHSKFGPTFGGGHDICVAKNAKTTWESHSKLSRTYKHPQYEFGTKEAQTFLVGSFEFQLDEIEVYQKE